MSHLDDAERSLRRSFYGRPAPEDSPRSRYRLLAGSHGRFEDMNTLVVYRAGDVLELYAEEAAGSLAGRIEAVDDSTPLSIPNVQGIADPVRDVQSVFWPWTSRAFLVARDGAYPPPRPWKFYDHTGPLYEGTP